jgi:hypothetical protein
MVREVREHRPGARLALRSRRVAVAKWVPPDPMSGECLSRSGVSKARLKPGLRPT